MKLTDEDIEEFMQIYREVFGKEIGRQEAFDGAHKLIRMVQILMEPDKENFKG